jgi:hypothetical protein
MAQRVAPGVPRCYLREPRCARVQEQNATSHAELSVCNNSEKRLE